MVENYASVGKRVLGAIIDMVLLFLIALIFSSLFGSVEAGAFSVSGLPALVMFILWFVYFVVLEATTGKTIGKYVAKTKVVDESGGQISWGVSVGRNLMRIIDGFFFYLVGFIVALVSKKNQRLGDIVSRTFVING